VPSLVVVVEPEKLGKLKTKQLLEPIQRGIRDRYVKHAIRPNTSGTANHTAARAAGSTTMIVSKYVSTMSMSSERQAADVMSSRSIGRSSNARRNRPDLSC
jgi:hypothetical protein